MKILVLGLTLTLSGCSAAFWGAVGDGLSASSRARTQSAANDAASRTPQTTQCRDVGGTIYCTTYGEDGPRTMTCQRVGGTLQCNGY